MNGRTRITLVLIASCAVLAPAAAQNIYKCADGYSQVPCPGGTPMQVDDGRSRAQKAQADAATKRDARTADAMEKARLAEEAKAPTYTPPPARTGTAGTLSDLPRQPPVFKATTAPDPGKAKKKTTKKKPADTAKAAAPNSAKADAGAKKTKKKPEPAKG